MRSSTRPRAAASSIASGRPAEPADQVDQRADLVRRPAARGAPGAAVRGRARRPGRRRPRRGRSRCRPAARPAGRPARPVRRAAPTGCRPVARTRSEGAMSASRLQRLGHGARRTLDGVDQQQARAAGAAARRGPRAGPHRGRSRPPSARRSRSTPSVTTIPATPPGWSPPTWCGHRERQARLAHAGQPDQADRRGSPARSRAAISATSPSRPISVPADGRPMTRRGVPPAMSEDGRSPGPCRRAAARKAARSSPASPSASASSSTVVRCGRLTRGRVRGRAPSARPPRRASPARPGSSPRPAAWNATGRRIPGQPRDRRSWAGRLRTRVDVARSEPAAVASPTPQTLRYPTVGFRGRGRGR